jgi:hypothetical protein
VANNDTLLREKAESVLRSIGDVALSDVAIGGQRHPLADASDAAGLTSLIGNIVLAGQYASGSYWVQFNSGSSGWASTWPAWAYEIARDALLYNKKVWVLSNGDPFGPNITSVLLYAP